jgi:hypothetical protein
MGPPAIPLKIEPPFWPEAWKSVSNPNTHVPN